MYGFYSSIIGSILVPLGAQFSISLRQQSVLFPANYVGSIILPVFAGYIADRMGKKNFLLIGLSFFAVMSLTFSFMQSYLAIILLFLLLGGSGSSINVTADSTIAEIFQTRKEIFLNLTHVFFGLGAITGPIVFSYLFSEFNDWRITYRLLVVLTVMIAILMLPSRIDQDETDKVQLSALKEIFKDRSYRILCLSMFICVGGQFILSTWIPTYVEKELGSSNSFSNWSLSIFWVAIVMGRILSAYLSTRMRPLTQIKFLTLSTAMATSALFFVRSNVGAAIIFFLSGLFLGGTIPLIVASTSNLSRKNTGTRFGVLYAFAGLGSFTFPTLIGVLGDVFTLGRAIPLASFLFALVFLFFRFLDRDVMLRSE